MGWWDEHKRTSIARKRLGPWTAVAVVEHQAGAVSLLEEAGAPRREEVELSRTCSVTANNPGQLATGGTIRTKNEREK